jgi:hypothetical protein
LSDEVTQGTIKGQKLATRILHMRLPTALKMNKYKPRPSGR